MGTVSSEYSVMLRKWAAAQGGLPSGARVTDVKVSLCEGQVYSEDTSDFSRCEVEIHSTLADGTELLTTIDAEDAGALLHDLFVLAETESPAHKDEGGR